MVDPAMVPFVQEMDALLRGAGCTVGMETAKSGYVVSYRHGPSGRVLANYVFRKKGVMIRIYADHVMQYMQLLEALPPALQAKVAKAPLCRRLVNPDKCNAHCPKGYEFILAGEGHQKCRYNAFLFFLDEDANPHIRAMLKRELACRAG